MDFDTGQSLDPVRFTCAEAGVMRPRRRNLLIRLPRRLFAMNYLFH